MLNQHKNQSVIYFNYFSVIKAISQHTTLKCWHLSTFPNTAGFMTSQRFMNVQNGGTHSCKFWHCKLLIYRLILIKLIPKFIVSKDIQYKIYSCFGLPSLLKFRIFLWNSFVQNLPEASSGNSIISGGVGGESSLLFLLPIFNSYFKYLTDLKDPGKSHRNPKNSQ